MFHRTWFVTLLWASVAAQRSTHYNIIPSSSLPPVPLRRYASVDSTNLISSIRGGGADPRPKKRSKKISSAKFLEVEQEQIKLIIPPEHTARTINNDGPKIGARCILIPRQTSFLKPLRFLSFLLMNMSFNKCMQTAGIPLDDAVRRILGMPSPGKDKHFSSKVTPLHLYVAKKIASSSASATTPSEMLPPGHLPSPLPLLGFFCSLLLYIGGTVLLPRWNVATDVLLNYEKFDVNRYDKMHVNDAAYALQNWFDENNDDGTDPNSSLSNNRLSPAILVNEMEVSGKSHQTVCPLFYSPGFGKNAEAKHLRHPRQYYFELDQKRYYFDPMCTANDNSQSPNVISGSPSLHEVDPVELVSDSYTRGLSSNTQLTYAKERYSAYSDVTIPVPTLQSAFAQRISSPLVSLQLLGRLLSLLEEESIGRAFANLARLGIQHFVDAKRSIASAITLAEEVKGIDKFGSGADGNQSRFWALRPTDKTTRQKKSKAKKENSEWVQVKAKELLPGDVFVIAPVTNSQGSKENAGGSSPHTSPLLTIPVDALLLAGTCVTEEAALTGETVPQAKFPLDFAMDEMGESDSNSSPSLDMNGIHRSSCVFAGTGLLHSSSWDEGTASSSSAMFNLPPLPRETFADNETLPAMYLTLRTGSYSSRGEIIQSLLKSRLHTGVSNRENEMDSIRLIGVLALFAVGACLFLLLDSSDISQKDSVFKRIVQCTRIAVASVPSDLPASLSACAHACATILREESDAVTSEAGALLESSKIDTIVFDKTGTLTADTQALASIAYPPCQPSVTEESLRFLADVILAGGNTLVGMGEDGKKLVGDPVDLAGLHYTRWKYNPHEKSAASSKYNAKLWQLRSFPFDPVKKMSSALILLQSNDGDFRLWVVVKGSPNVIRDLVSRRSVDHSWYDSKVSSLGKLGHRSIGLGALDVTDTYAVGVLFPSGMPTPNDNSFTLEDRIHEARRHARESFVRNDIEGQSSEFIGFACFNAPMRSSSRRVVDELKSSTEVIMLTGDEPNSSLAIANKAGIINGKQSLLCLLKTNGLGLLVWEVNGKLRRFDLEMAKEVQLNVERQNAVLIITGDAASALLSRKCIGETAQYVQDKLLPQTSLVASASPNDKSLFVKWLQNSRKRNVLMCGDGVNDIAAMREATVSVAMLSGFGHESEAIIATDAGDLRRKERLKRRRIGSNRQLPLKSKSSTLDESCARIQHDIIEGMRQIQREDNETPKHTTVIDVCLASIKDELKRHKDLKKGGSDAAKILAEEDRLRRSLECKAPAKLEDRTVETNEIQTGESCLASSFTLLRPCISGVESILRTGVSAAACGISLYRKVALNCMLSCYNLTTLYKNGLRYGKWMWQVELYSMIFTDRASFAASSTPRPRLVASVRPSTTPFHPSEVLSTTLQVIIHIVSLTVAVNFGRQLELKYPTGRSHKGFSIQWSDDKMGASAGSLLSTLVGSSTSNPLHSDADAAPQSFLKRSPFQPNYISNNVFIMSVFQNAVTAMVNYSGMPFSIAFLESRSLCLSVSLAFLLCIVCISESAPLLNKFIQLAPYPTKSSRVAMLRLLLLNASTSYFAEYFSTFFLRHDIWKERNKTFHTDSHIDSDQSSMSAVKEEEKLLYEERLQNTMIVSLICFLIFHLSIQILRYPQEQPLGE